MSQLDMNPSMQDGEPTAMKLLLREATSRAEELARLRREVRVARGNLLVPQRALLERTAQERWVEKQRHQIAELREELETKKAAMSRRAGGDLASSVPDTPQSPQQRLLEPKAQARSVGKHGNNGTKLAAADISAGSRKKEGAGKARSPSATAPKASTNSFKPAPRALAKADSPSSRNLSRHPARTSKQFNDQPRPDKASSGGNSPGQSTVQTKSDVGRADSPKISSGRPSPLSREWVARSPTSQPSSPRSVPLPSKACRTCKGAPLGNTPDLIAERFVRRAAKRKASPLSTARELQRNPPETEDSVGGSLTAPDSFAGQQTDLSVSRSSATSAQAASSSPALLQRVRMLPVPAGSSATDALLSLSRGDATMPHRLRMAGSRSHSPLPDKAGSLPSQNAGLHHELMALNSVLRRPAPRVGLEYQAPTISSESVVPARVNGGGAVSSLPRFVFMEGVTATCAVGYNVSM
mmetsp:Transcript_51923/g.121517  ORF Transcript_51923/g.121517 Transcript_51923/m.121517 type:complete len:468 (-) Transcript_51923:6-1409(-)